VTAYIKLARYIGVAKAGWTVRPWRHFCGGGTMGYAVGYKPVQAVLK